jgi:ATP-dependent RNA helicase DDX10/DBP4
MFQRKNQNILSDHYNKLIDFEEDNLLDGETVNEDDDFITLRRRDHKLESDVAYVQETA